MRLIKNFKTWKQPCLITASAIALAHGGTMDSAQLTDLLAEEDVMAYDRAPADQRCSSDETACATENSMADPGPDDALDATSKALFALNVHDACSSQAAAEKNDTTAGEASGTAASMAGESYQARECHICKGHKQDPVVLRAPCGHHFCQPCLDILFELSAEGTTASSPQCCGQNVF